MSKGSTQRPTDKKKFDEGYDKVFNTRIDMIGLNGNNGEHYLIEKIARAIAGEEQDLPMMGRNRGKKRWEVYVDSALRVRESLSEELSD